MLSQFGYHRFRDVLPILLAYVRSRQAPGKPVLWIAHNAKQFDVPFLNLEFDRCSAQVPADWLFVDSLLLAKKLKKIDGMSSYIWVPLII
jgi:DNA polymerase III epsilon subunit-like protein